MADIVERLKAHDLNICPDWRDETECHAWIDLADALLSEAATEIATLRQQIEEAREAISQAIGSLKALGAENGFASEALRRALSAHQGREG